MNATQYKKELLYRKARGKIIYESYKIKIASLFKMEPDCLTFLDLETTDNILSKSNAFDTRKTKKKLDIKDLKPYILELKKILGPHYVFLNEDWIYCGAFTVPSLQELNEDFHFDNEILNDVLFISMDLRQSISLDYYEMNGVYYIDVITKFPIRNE
ncbi:hypothetical protein C5930_18165 [Cronobacter sakazakii]|uniref:hypothetical protein n=1 Tax=Cronobacter sakazakii TaxID=28141 RepID=UPI000CFC1E89|nr:hypothetical protein [Cronobacter sakazakii]PQX92474.1 hypothetical protein C5930_18165 [Cronobacter sakazakii]PRO50250.1 hypothetical protein C5943_11455 [Cronobacter sakazakii]